MREIIETGTKMIRRLLDVHADEINAAYLNGDEGGVAVNIKLLIEPDRGVKKITTGISFVESRVKDSSIRFIDEKQIPLPLEP